MSSHIEHFSFQCCAAIEILILLKSKNTHCHGCSNIKDKENFTPPNSFQRFQICPNITFLQLNFVNCIIRHNVDYRCSTCCLIKSNNYSFSFAVWQTCFAQNDKVIEIEKKSKFF